ncbi:lysine transporter LysE [Labrys miyagiensis]|uniref:Lysine transporter LysE n=1 Tax=Labrys miyagiensis TaxID=346912 RepID=A0ABQ6CBN3_9HYPH|nr:LysE family translocator [Labrys miyagiensis]GLS17555.1 lysine transporter LysE [Labrys miyagiensis]
MLSLATILTFTAVAVGMVLTPGPNMAYLVSRSICQGRLAGLISLGGVVTGFLVYMLLTAFGITALLLAVPVAYDVLRLAGAAYLAWMAWQALKPGGRSPFEVRELKPDSPRRLFGMGLFTSLLNPKIAALYLSLLPQFVDHGGNVLGQTLQLGLIQIATSAFFNALFVVMAGTISAFLAGRPLWTTVQRWLMGTVLMGLAARMALDTARR